MRISDFFLEVILISRFTDSFQPISTGNKIAEGRNCSFLYMTEIDFFGSSSPGLESCKKANHKCKICQKKTGREREICLAVYKRKYVKRCKTGMKNPHGLTESQMKRITRLNDFKQGSKLRNQKLVHFRYLSLSYYIQAYSQNFFL